jgi:outer membrane protein
MKRYALFVAGLVIFTLTLTGSLAAAAEKTGFVDVREVMFTSNAGKKENDDIKKSIDKTKAIIRERENELTKLKDELEKQRPLLKEEAPGLSAPR